MEMVERIRLGKAIGVSRKAMLVVLVIPVMLLSVPSGFGPVGEVAAEETGSGTDPLWTEGFETGDYQERWTLREGEGAEGERVNHPVHQGEWAFQVTTGCGALDNTFHGASVTREVIIPSKGKAVASTWVLSDQDGTWGRTGLIELSDSDSQSTRALVKIGADNSDNEVFGYRIDEGGSHEAKDFGTWETGKWYKLTIVVDASQNRVTFKASSSKGPIAERSVDNAPVDFDRLRVSADPGSHRGTCDDVFLFDDVSFDPLVSSGVEPTIQVQQDTNSWSVEPLKNGQTVEEMYRFGRNRSEADPTIDILRQDRSLLFFWHGPDGLSLVILHDHKNADSGGAVDFEMRGLPTEKGRWVIEDDGYEPFNVGSGTTSVNWKWNPGNTDGGAFRGISDAPDPIVIESTWDQDASRWDEARSPEPIEGWELLTGDVDDPTRISLDKGSDLRITMGGEPSDSVPSTAKAKALRRDAIARMEVYEAMETAFDANQPAEAFPGVLGLEPEKFVAEYSFEAAVKAAEKEGLVHASAGGATAAARAVEAGAKVLHLVEWAGWASYLNEVQVEIGGDLPTQTSNRGSVSEHFADLAAAAERERAAWCHLAYEDTNVYCNEIGVGSDSEALDAATEAMEDQLKGLTIGDVAEGRYLDRAWVMTREECVDGSDRFPCPAPLSVTHEFQAFQSLEVPKLQQRLTDHGVAIQGFEEPRPPSEGEYLLYDADNGRFQMIPGSGLGVDGPAEVEVDESFSVEVTAGGATGSMLVGSGQAIRQASAGSEGSWRAPPPVETTSSKIEDGQALFYVVQDPTDGVAEVLAVEVIRGSGPIQPGIGILGVAISFGAALVLGREWGRRP